MPEALAWRALLAATPFAVWLVWRWIAVRTGRPMGSTPWPWLAAMAAVLLGISLMATVILHGDNRGEVYSPGQVGADGRVSPGHFEKRADRK